MQTIYGMYEQVFGQLRRTDALGVRGELDEEVSVIGGRTGGI